MRNRLPPLQVIAFAIVALGLAAGILSPAIWDIIDKIH